MVLPDPGPPISNVVRPRGKPPSLISSKPAIPVGAFLDAAAAGERSDFIVFPFPRNAQWSQRRLLEKFGWFPVSGDYVRRAAAVCAAAHIGGEGAKGLGIRPTPRCRDILFRNLKGGGDLP